MPATKSSATLLNAVTTSQTSASQNVATDYAMDVYVSIVQVGTATTAASFFVTWTPDGSTTFNSATYTAGLTAATYSFPPVSLPPTAQSVTVTFTAQAGGTSSTCTAILGQVTGI